MLYCRNGLERTKKYIIYFCFTFTSSLAAYIFNYRSVDLAAYSNFL